MIIRKAKKSDLDEVYNIFKEYDSLQIRYLPKRLRHIRNKKSPCEEVCKKGLLSDIRKRNGLFLVAVENDKIIGYIFGTYGKYNHPVFDFPLEGSLEDIAVKKGNRGKGVASKLWKELLSWFKEKNCDNVVLKVIDKNPAKDVYKYWGFITSANIMRKKL